VAAAGTRRSALTHILRNMLARTVLSRCAALCIAA
jgi:hypothetical protein